MMNNGLFSPSFFESWSRWDEQTCLKDPAPHLWPCLQMKSTSTKPQSSHFACWIIWNINLRRPTGCGSSVRGSQAGTICGFSRRGPRMLRSFNNLKILITHHSVAIKTSISGLYTLHSQALADSFWRQWTHHSMCSWTLRGPIPQVQAQSPAYNVSANHKYIRRWHLYQTWQITLKL